MWTIIIVVESIAFVCLLPLAAEAFLSHMDLRWPVKDMVMRGSRIITGVSSAVMVLAVLAILRWEELANRAAAEALASALIITTAQLGWLFRALRRAQDVETAMRMLEKTRENLQGTPWRK